MDTAHKIGTAEMWGERIAAIRAGGIASIADAILVRWFSPAFHARASGRARRLAQHAHPDAARRLSRLLRRHPRCRSDRRRAAACAVPTLCMVGDQDGSTPPDLVAELAELIPGARS